MNEVQQLKDTSDILTVEEAARYMRISRNSAFEAVRKGELPAVRIGRRLLVSKQALIRLFETASVPVSLGAVG